jgi:hypothetical protein
MDHAGQNGIFGHVDDDDQSLGSILRYFAVLFSFTRSVLKHRRNVVNEGLDPPAIGKIA